MIYRGETYQTSLQYDEKNRTIVRTVKIIKKDVLLPDYIEWRAKDKIIKENSVYVYLKQDR